MTELGELWQENVDAIRDADTPDATVDAAEPIIEGIAKKMMDDDTLAVESWSDQLAGKTGLTKTAIKDAADSMARDMESELVSDGDKTADETPLDTLLKERLEKVTIYRSSDSNTDTDYHWEIEGGIEFVTTNGEHWSFEHMRDAYLDSAGELPKPPHLRESEEWKRFVADLMQEYG